MEDTNELAEINGNTLNKPSITQASILFSVSVIAFMFLGSRAYEQNFYFGAFITEMILVFFPAIILLHIYRYDFKKVLRLNRVTITNLILIFLMIVIVIPLVGMINVAYIYVIKLLFGHIEIPKIPVARTFMELLLNMFFIGAMAGVCEETLFRGIIQRSYERLGATKAIFLTAFLFGLMHADFQRLMGTFLLGALIGFVTYRTNSLYAGMFAHFSNNCLMIVLTYVIDKISAESITQGIGGADSNNIKNIFSSIPTIELIIVTITYTVIGVFFISCFVGVLYIFLKNTSNCNKEKCEKEAVKIRSFAWIIPGITMIALIYLKEGFDLKGIHFELLNKTLNLLLH